VPDSDRTDITEVTAGIVRFRDERSWTRSHNAEDLALALSIEVAELNERFRENSWRRRCIGAAEKLTDVFICALLLAEKYALNPLQIIRQKDKNELSIGITTGVRSQFSLHSSN
jgi:NTP pyrophosphatase (non-canonical NTP hydrolase)